MCGVTILHFDVVSTLIW